MKKKILKGYLKMYRWIDDIPMIKTAVRAVRADLPYQPGNCLNEAHMLSMDLAYRGIDNIVEIGEAVLVPGRQAWEKQYYRAVHRNMPCTALQEKEPAWHMWLVLENGQILDMSIGSWTCDLPENLKREFIYGPPELGLSIDHRWDRHSLYDLCKSLEDNELAYAYKPHTRYMKRKLAADGLKFGHLH